jgi:hypothetical protein
MNFMSISIGTLALIATLGSAKAQSLDIIRQDVAAEFEKECFQVQRPNPLNNNMTDSQLTMYCGCTAQALASGITLDDVAAYRQTGHLPSARERGHDAGTLCAGVVAGTIAAGRR